MILWTRSTLPMIALVLAACAPLEEVSTSGNVDPSETTGEPTTTTTAPGTTLPGDATAVGTMDGTGMSTTTMGPVDTTMDVSTADGETTMGVDPTSGSSSGVPPECLDPEGCGNNETCDGGQCVPACEPWGAGDYGYCLTEYGGLDTDDICGAGHTCVRWGNPYEQTACSFQGCASECDCPPPAATGDATVTCGQITNPAGMNDCYLSCANMETCPDGMTCLNNNVCVTTVPEVPVYGDCGNLAPDCAGTGFCTYGSGGESVCMRGCNNVGECPTAPPTGNANVTCGYASNPPPGTECYLDCSGGLSCPDGMSCYSGYICIWPN